MAIKTFCDVCEKEIKQGDEVASITSIEKRLALPLAGSPKGTIPTMQSVSITRLTCGKCFKPIKKIFENVKKV